MAYGCARAATTPGAAGLSGSIPIGWAFAALLVGFLGSSLFTILDFAIFSIDPRELQDLARVRPQEWEPLARLRAHLSLTWVTLLCGSVLCNLLFAVSTAWLTLRALGGGTGFVQVTVTGIVSITVVLVFGEVLPGVLAGRWLHSLAPLAGRLTGFFTWILAPVYVGPLYAIRALARLTGAPLHDSDRVLEVEKRLLTLIGVGEVDVTFEEEEREMIDHALEFGDRMARDIMTPRNAIEGFDDSLEQDEVLERMRNAPHSRILVYRRSLDDLVGILHAKHALLEPETDYHQLIVPPLFVPEDMDLLNLTALMRRRRSQLVVVLDEYGSTDGVVSMNDVLEAIVGPEVHDDVEGRGDESEDAEDDAT